MQKLFKQWFGRTHMPLRLALLVSSVILMGLCVAMFDTLQVGTDPCSSLSLGISRKIGISFGTMQLAFNALLMIIVICIDWRGLGLGTLANMVLCGYSADFFFPIIRCILPLSPSLPLRIGIFLPTMALFVTVVALYLLVDLGSAPYDALPLLIARHYFPRHMRLVRVLWDLGIVCLSLCFQGSVGIMTLLCIFFLGPVIGFFTDRFGAYFR